jgi:hypothetical protein
MGGARCHDFVWERSGTSLWRESLYNAVMSLEIFVDAYSGFRANERPRYFHVDEDFYEIASVEEQWRSPEGLFFRVRSTEGKRYLLRYEEQTDRWTLQSGLDGTELLARPSIRLVSVEATTIREAESRIAACERCRPQQGVIPFDWILADVLLKRGAFEFVLTETALCPNCRAVLLEKTLVEPQGGVEIERPIEA